METIVFSSGISPWGGGLGWRRKDANSKLYDYSNYARGLAHDTMDHFNQQTIEDEVMAHGAEAWIRFGKQEKIEKVADRFSRDIGLWPLNDYVLISNIGALVSYNRRILPDIECQPLMDKDVENILMHSKVQHYLAQEFGDFFTYNNWFRYGFHKAAERYAHIGSEKANKIYKNLINIFNESLFTIKPDQELVISI